VTLKTTATLLGTTEQDFRGDVSRGCMVNDGKPGDGRRRAAGLAATRGSRCPTGDWDDPFLSVNVHDNGHPVDGQPVDQASAILLFEATAAAVCAGTRTLAVFPLEHGNFIVIDS
jgi:hypothetical protein